MAERRMFAKSVLDSDSFMSLPFSAQALYVHLAMRADDDGFIGNARSIMRMLGADKKDTELLSEQGFIRTFDSGVVAIIHWKVNNYIQKDRYKPSIYRKEKEIMYPCDEASEDEDFSVSDLDTQVRIGKDSIGKDSSGKDSSGQDSSGQDSIGKDSSGKDSTVQHSSAQHSIHKAREDEQSIYEGLSDESDCCFCVSESECERVIELYNRICTSLSRVCSLTNSRREGIARLLKKHTFEHIEEAFRKVQGCDFLCGKGERGWKASFDWLLKGDNFLRVLEGAYDKSKKEENEPAYDIEAYERYSIFD